MFRGCCVGSFKFEVGWKKRLGLAGICDPGVGWKRQTTRKLRFTITIMFRNFDWTGGYLNRRIAHLCLINELELV